MTCPFYVIAGRPEFILGDDRAERHCGPRTYPAGVCNLDGIGRGEAWRAVVGRFSEIACSLLTPVEFGDETTEAGIQDWFDLRMSETVEINALWRTAVGWLQ